MLFFSRWKAIAALAMAVIVCLFAAPDFLSAQTVKVEFRLVDYSVSVEQALQSGPPRDSEVLFGFVDKRPYLVEKGVVLSGADLCDAQPGQDMRTPRPIVNFRFTPAGTKLFAQVTQENVGRAFAIVIDNEVVFAPVIREPILGGSGQISGNFTLEQVAQMAERIRTAVVAKY